MLLTDEQCSDALILQSTIFLLTAKLSESLQQVSSALRLDPDNAEARKLRLRVKNVIRHKVDGNTFFNEGRWQEAVDQYVTAMEVRCIIYALFLCAFSEALL